MVSDTPPPPEEPTQKPPPPDPGPSTPPGPGGGGGVPSPNRPSEYGQRYYADIGKAVVATALIAGMVVMAVTETLPAGASGSIMALIGGYVLGQGVIAAKGFVYSPMLGSSDALGNTPTPQVPGDRRYHGRDYQ